MSDAMAVGALERSELTYDGISISDNALMDKRPATFILIFLLTVEHL